MRDDHVIPCIAILMTKNNKMIGHRVAAIWRFKPIAQLNCLAERGLCKVDMVNVCAFAGSCGRRTLSGCRRR
jgi:hypothetical protein